jgi:hypothetical protein
MVGELGNGLLSGAWVLGPLELEIFAGELRGLDTVHLGGLLEESGGEGGFFGLLDHVRSLD